MESIFCRLYAGIAALVLFVVTAHLSLANDHPSSQKSSIQKSSIYVKVILPMESPDEGSDPIVESWIANELRERGRAYFRAVTRWVRLDEEAKGNTPVWDAIVDGTRWGCPVVGKVIDGAEDGEVMVGLFGWSPGAPEIEGQNLAAEIGGRKIAVVDTGQRDDSGLAYVAILVVPELPSVTSSRKMTTP